MSDEGHVDAGVIVNCIIFISSVQHKPEQWAAFKYINQESYKEMTLLQL